MKYGIFYVFIFVSSLVFSQEKLDSKQIYFVNNLAYKIIDNNLFTGVIEDLKKNHRSYFAECKDGIISQESFYYNFKKNMGKDIEYKKVYYSNNIKSKEEIFHSTSEKHSTLEFDEQGRKKYFELLKNGKIILTQNFKNGKLDGKVTCYDKKGNYQEYFYTEGKLIK